MNGNHERKRKKSKLVFAFLIGQVTVVTEKVYPQPKTQTINDKREQKRKKSKIVFEFFIGQADRRFRLS